MASANLRPLRMAGSPTQKFSPRKALVTEQVTTEAVTVRVEMPDDAEFWGEFEFSEARLRAYLAQIDAAKKSVADAEILAEAAAREREDQRVDP